MCRPSVGWLTPVARAAPIRLPCSSAAKKEGMSAQLKLDVFINEWLVFGFMQLCNGAEVQTIHLRPFLNTF